MTEQKYKPIKFRALRHQEIEDLRDKLVRRRGNDNLSLPDAVSEAVRYYSEFLDKVDS